MQRKTCLDHLRSGSERFDILIIGGGATGLGAAVDAAARGHRVALVEQADFAKGTSSRSTKLVHGGVRYLKQGNVSLVREALRERGRMARNAPHVVHDLEFIIPIYTWRDALMYGAGLKVYDAMSGRLSLGPSLWLSREETIRRLPTVETNGLRGGVLYHDGQFDDTRLAVNLAATAVTLGGCIVNYCRCAALLKSGDRVEGAMVVDEESGPEFAVRAKVVVNATGVFVDAVRKLDEPAARPIVAVSQGIHFVLPKRFLPGDAALMVPKTADGRVLFALPWHDRVVVGTTDTPVPQPSLEPRALDEECEFVMSHARQYLAEDPSDSDVLSVFAGLRPLVKAGDASNTASLSRDHTILVSRSGLITVTGGKWTTYRKMGADVIDQAERVAGLPHRASGTETLAIHASSGATRAPAHLAVYGSDATRIEELARANPALRAPVHPALSCRGAEIVWHAREEMARTVEDVLARRTRSLLLDAQAAIEAAPAVARILSEELQRDETWIARQIEEFTRVAEPYLYRRARTPQPEHARHAHTAR